MAYRVSYSDNAERQLYGCFAYIFYEFKDKFAAEAFLKDADETAEQLSQIANSFPLCEDEELNRLGYRIIHFKKHRYKFVYRIDGKRAIIEAVYHNLQELKKPEL